MNSHGLLTRFDSCRFPFVAIVCIWSTLVLVGCQAPGTTAPAPTPGPAATRTGSDAQLDQRARKLLLRAAQSGDAIVRANAIEALAELAPHENLPVFRAAVASEYPVVQYAGLLALGEVRDRQSLPAIHRLADDPNPRIRLAAAFVVYRCGNHNAAAILMETLAQHPDEKVRAEAARLVGELGERRAIKRLRLAFKREESSYVLVHIEAAMAKLGDARSRERMVEYTLKSDMVTILLALQTLADLADARTYKTLRYRLANEAEYLQTRLLAARGLGAIGKDDGYKLALQSLQATGRDKTETMQIHTNAALALGAIGKREALPALKRLAEFENDPRSQVAACYAICQILESPAPRRQP